jgi:protein-S-isoprenylcysteine O-methyltransferase Ste14
MFSKYYIILAIFLACLAIRDFYEILKKAGKINSGKRAVFATLVVVMCILWTSWFSMCLEDPIKMVIPHYIRWLGLGIWAIGLVLAVGAFIQLRGVENIDHLETGGLFAKLRHPMYLGFICWFIGWSLFHRAGLSTIPGVIGIINVLYWRSLEEAHLEKTHGERYREYRKRTWF